MLRLIASHYIHGILSIISTPLGTYMAVAIYNRPSDTMSHSTCQLQTSAFCSNSSSKLVHFPLSTILLQFICSKILLEMYDNICLHVLPLYMQFTTIYRTSFPFASCCSSIENQFIFFLNSDRGVPREDVRTYV